MMSKMLTCFLQIFPIVMGLHVNKYVLKLMAVSNVLVLVGICWPMMEGVVMVCITDYVILNVVIIAVPIAVPIAIM